MKSIETSNERATVEAPKPGERTALEVTVSYGDAVIDVRHLVAPKGLVVGDGKAVDLVVSTEQLPVSEFPLLRAEKDLFVLTFSEHQKGEIDLGDGAIHPLPWFAHDKRVGRDPALSSCYRYVLPRAANVTLRFDGVVLALSYVTPPEPLQQQETKRDYRYAAVILSASVALLCVMALILVFGSTKPETYTSPESAAADARGARLLGGATPERRAVFLSPPIVLGALSEDDADRAFAVVADDVERCLSPLSSAAAVEARLQVDASGTVGQASFDIAGADAAAADAARSCLGVVASKLRLAPPIDGRATLEARLR